MIPARFGNHRELHDSCVLLVRDEAHCALRATALGAACAAGAERAYDHIDLQSCGCRLALIHTCKRRGVIVPRRALFAGTAGQRGDAGAL